MWCGVTSFVIGPIESSEEEVWLLSGEGSRRGESPARKYMELVVAFLFPDRDVGCTCTICCTIN